ncbi:hypothetical protein RU639_013831 [Aspergillus parasiticus]|uniref:Uncharacterized protein n=1 Tax=Aspergillus sergii TaxID=1034303 RepID=A0A5N6XIC2_9EURO|nr:hypothetical protein BDV39DRAFT_166120 [Aspergillus sergii]
MKSPIYLLTTLLPLVAQLTGATPTEDHADYDSLEERTEGFSIGDKQAKQGACTIERPFQYYKYPCDSSDRVGEARRGEQWQSSCKYKNFYKTKNGWWAKQENKPRNCRVSESKC